MNLYQKLIEVRKQVPYLQKEKEMLAGQKYKYVGAEDVYRAIRSKMDDIGVYLQSEIVDTIVTQGTNKNGSITYFTEIKMRMTWINAENPEEKLVSEFYAQGTDTGGEKGVGKALTYGGKYFIMSQFQIATGKDDPDGIEPPETQKPKPKQQPQNKPVSKPKQPDKPKQEPKTKVSGEAAVGAIKSMASSTDAKQLNDIKDFVKSTELDKDAHCAIIEYMSSAKMLGELEVVATYLQLVGKNNEQRNAMMGSFAQNKSRINSDG